LRGLTQQQAIVDGLHISAGTLILAASFASSLLGSRALSRQTFVATAPATPAGPAGRSGIIGSDSSNSAVMR
jgi:hypothetical protein